ncbi:MAG: glycerate-2-kinase family protein, partial [Candidatus Coatesbacteria bacterium]|nr:glycerate-2-kinase family protein [Candidatus Coatesbacteria bacterium]
MKDLRADALEIFKSGLKAVEAGQAVRCALRRSGSNLTFESIDHLSSIDISEFDRVFLVGGGKASGAMAEAFIAAIGPENISGGAISIPADASVPDLPLCIDIFEATHPLPSEGAVVGAKRMIEIADAATEKDLIVFLLSGGASAILPLPADGITLDDKVETTKLLLACGARIDEINAIRKHISAIKGGQFVKAAYPAKVISLIISDVIGHRLESIGSGPTVRDTTTFADCLGIARKYRLLNKLPKSVLKHLKDGALGKFAGPEDIPESVFERC